MPPAFHSAIDRSNSTATMATPPAATSPPNSAPNPARVPQSPEQLISTNPNPMAAPANPEITTAKKAPTNAPRLAA